MKRLLMLITFLIFCPDFSNASGQRGFHVLYISSYNPSFPTFNQQVGGIKSVFDSENILLDIEFMDTKRFPGAENISVFHNMLSFKLKRLPAYDAIIVADDAALLYGAARSRGLFKNLPVFFCGVNDIEKGESLKKGYRIRGIAEAVSMRDTLELARSLFPGRTKLAVITDGTITGQADLKNLLTVSGDMAFKTDVLSLVNLTYDQLNLKLRGLGEDYSLLLLSAYTDSTGSTRLFYDELAEIYRNSQVPLFHLYEHGIGKGVFGGKLINHFEQGREAAVMTLRYLHGTPLEKMDNILESPNRYSFDYNELNRFNIPLSRIPEGSIVLNRPLSFYETHRRVILSSVIIISALLCLIIVQQFESRRLRKMYLKKTMELAKSEERWKFSLESAGQVVWDWDIAANKIYTLQKWDNPLELDVEEEMDMEEWLTHIHGDDRDNMIEAMISYLSGKTSVYEMFHRIMVKDGTSRWVLARGKVIERFPDGNPGRVIGTATDITGLKRIEAEINSSRRMLQLILDTIPIGVFWKDRDLKYIGCNNSFTELIGLDSTENIVGKKDIELFDYETAMSYNASDLEVVDSGKAKLNYEDQRSLPSGKIRILRKSKVPLTDDNGNIIGVLGTNEDITEQKNLREEIFRIQKLESVGILASGIAHDFNNLLMAISGSLSVLRITEGLSGKTLHWIEQTEKSCLAATELTTRLITFSRGGAPVLQKENIADLIKEAAGPDSVSSAVVVNYHNESPVNDMMIDGRQIRQVVINIIENAKESMPEGGVVNIVSSEIIFDDNNTYKLKPGRYMKISFKDTGPGIPESIIDKIFDPYFSTKGAGQHKGQGLGLAICHSIITQHGGIVTVNSAIGMGALFTVYIPFDIDGINT